jgi:hypothetical protein
MPRFLLAALSLTVVAAMPTAAKAPSAALPMPAFRFDTQWLKLPAGLATGEIVAVAVDDRAICGCYIARAPSPTGRRRRSLR